MLLGGFATHRTMVSHICIQYVGMYVNLLVAIAGTLIVWAAGLKMHMLAGPAT